MEGFRYGMEWTISGMEDFHSITCPGIHVTIP